MRLKADLQLLLVAMVWGSAFVAQRVAARSLSPFTFNGLRFLLAGIILLPWARFSWKTIISEWRYIFSAGLLIFAASALQQAGLHYTTAANAGFLTSLYVVFVPLVLFLWRKQNTAPSVWLAIILAVVGAYLLSAGGQGNLLGFRLAPGDGLELFGAILWALHVIVIGLAVKKVPVLLFAVGQYLIASILNLGIAFWWEPIHLPALWGAGWAIAYTGILSVGLGYTLQVSAQRHAPPVDAALLLSSEAVFAALGGYWFLAEKLTWIQGIGCCLILVAILIAQLRVIHLGGLYERFKKLARDQ